MGLTNGLFKEIKRKGCDTFSKYTYSSVTHILIIIKNKNKNVFLFIKFQMLCIKMNSFYFA